VVRSFFDPKVTGDGGNEAKTRMGRAWAVTDGVLVARISAKARWENLRSRGVSARFQSDDNHQAGRLGLLHVTPIPERICGYRRVPFRQRDVSLCISRQD